MEIDLRLLQYAVTLSRHRHFGRAAAALGVSQPTLSRNIATLEKQLGMRVFERSHRDVVATPAGDDVLRMAGELVARADAIAKCLELIRDGRGGRLRVVAGTYAYDIAVRPASIELINASPSIRLELLEREWAAVLALVMTDQVDFAVFDVESLRSMPALKVESLGMFRGRYFCRTGHPLVRKKALRADDVRRYPLVMPGMPRHQSSLIDGLDAGFTRDATGGNVLPSIAVSTFRTVRDIVAETDAIGIAHVSQIGDDLAAERFAVLDLPWLDKPPAAELGIAYKRDRTLPSAARSFIAIIRKRMRAVADD